MIHITILFGLQPSKSSTPADFSQFKHWRNVIVGKHAQKVHSTD